MFFYFHCENSKIEIKIFLTSWKLQQNTHTHITSKVSENSDVQRKERSCLGSGDEFFMIVQKKWGWIERKSKQRSRSMCEESVGVLERIIMKLPCKQTKSPIHTQLPIKNLTKITKSKFLLVPFFQFAVKTVQVADSDSSVSPIFLVFF